MAHQLDIMAVENLSSRKIRRGIELQHFPRTVLNVLGMLGFIPPNSSRHLSSIIRRSIQFECTGALTSLVRNRCSVNFYDLDEVTQRLVAKEIRTDSQKGGVLLKIVTQIPFGDLKNF